jgi:hypothetical protein
MGSKNLSVTTVELDESSEDGSMVLLSTLCRRASEHISHYWLSRERSKVVRDMFGKKMISLT